MNVAAPNRASSEKVTNMTSTKSHDEARSINPAIMATAIKSNCACGGGCPRCKSKNGDIAFALQHRQFIKNNIEIGAANDPQEQEADDVADQVLNSSRHSFTSETPLHLKRKSGQSSMQLSSTSTNIRHILASEGRPLDKKTREFFEPRFRQDFSEVRVHTDTTAARSAR